MDERRNEEEEELKGREELNPEEGSGCAGASVPGVADVVDVCQH